MPGLKSGPISEARTNARQRRIPEVLLESGSISEANARKGTKAWVGRIGPDFSPGYAAVMGWALAPWDMPYMVGGVSVRCAYGVDEETHG